MEGDCSEFAAHFDVEKINDPIKMGHFRKKKERKECCERSCVDCHSS
jgi:hypothetical protein